LTYVEFSCIFDIITSLSSWIAISLWILPEIQFHILIRTSVLKVSLKFLRFAELASEHFTQPHLYGFIAAVVPFFQTYRSDADACKLNQKLWLSVLRSFGNTKIDVSLFLTN
jgi:hypothetical protein